MSSCEELEKDNAGADTIMLIFINTLNPSPNYCQPPEEIDVTMTWVKLRLKNRDEMQVERSTGLLTLNLLAKSMFLPENPGNGRLGLLSLGS